MLETFSMLLSFLSSITLMNYHASSYRKLNMDRWKTRVISLSTEREREWERERKFQRKFPKNLSATFISEESP